MTRTRLIGGILLVAFSLAFMGVFALESSRVQLGFDDGDNPEQSVAFLREHGVIYEVSGTLQIMMSVALVIGVLVVANTFGQGISNLSVNISSVFGIFAAAGYFLNGALRLAVGLSLVTARRRLLPKAILLLAAFPAFHLFAAIFLPFLGEPPSALFLLYVFSIFGTVLWCLVLGIFLVRLKTVR